MYGPALLQQRTSCQSSGALLLVTSSVTPVTCDELPLVTSCAGEASNLDVVRNWHLHRHGHHSGARLNIREALHWEVLHCDYAPIEAKIDLKDLVWHLERDLVHEHLVEDLIGRPRGKVDTPKI